MNSSEQKLLRNLRRPELHVSLQLHFRQFSDTISFFRDPLLIYLGRGLTLDRTSLLMEVVFDELWNIDSECSSVA